MVGVVFVGTWRYQLWHAGQVSGERLTRQEFQCGLGSETEVVGSSRLHNTDVAMIVRNFSSTITKHSTVHR